MRRFDVALLLVTLGLVVLVFVNGWFGLGAAVGGYMLIARLAGRHLDHLSQARLKALRKIPKH